MIYASILEKLYPWITFRLNSDNHNNLYLTFDDGPDPNSTLRVFEILEKYRAKASFFVVGKQVEKHPNVVEVLDKNGHLTCNHSYQHRKFYSKKLITEEIKKAQELINSIVEKPGFYYRPPHGRIYPGLKQAVNLLGLNVVLWDVFVPDFKTSFDSNKISNKILSNAKCGSIILLHDRSENVKETIKALPNIIKIFTDQGFSFTTLPRDY